ncbi:MAG: DUF6599 family protein [Armatimonadota bacterium]|nr:hypothetical protein [Armatimonadota bacterium]MCX7778113.1 hypothetical protein [Armatimonadota bacterium]MDW8026174.1 DUF6599 family protein [Armatimonadota bacterium]
MMALHMLQRCAQFLLALFLCAALTLDCKVECGENQRDILSAFPQRIANAMRIGNPKTWNERTVFDYMDGAAELYLRYGFKLLHTASYKLPDQTADVELYDMGNSKDAFGVFSWDMHGEQLQLGQGARYEGGVLRCWQDKFFIKVKGQAHSESFRQFAIAIAKHITKWVGKQGLLPDLISVLPSHMKPTGIRYFHCDEDLNSFHYVSTENVLGLSHSTEGIIADCSINNTSVKVIVIRYPSTAARDKAMREFCEKALPASSRNAVGDKVFAQVRGKFCGAVKFKSKRNEPLLAICFEAPSQDVCKSALQSIVNAALNSSRR